MFLEAELNQIWVLVPALGMAALIWGGLSTFLFYTTSIPKQGPNTALLRYVSLDPPMSSIKGLMVFIRWYVGSLKG